ncbi:coiled-coil domain-containing protein 34-like isoform X1 [Salvelinus fontinalis]|uniref:coiled-coil domain-containing protein 34-like isoform X1 n=2 Tax=Salvelinus fontinalis TaxID=8038 RepID=UPI002485A18E|nr:coiled-coil domain-containing protein 34-like isoform X1 [Salvelinus fontinalis]
MDTAQRLLGASRSALVIGGKMSSFPASASKSFSSTPLKTYQDSGRELHRSKSVDYDSTGDSTYSLLSPIYHDSYESDEDLAAAHHVHQIDTSATQSDDARPLSPIRYDPQQKPPERRAVTEAEDPEASLSAWERWLVCKAKEERLRIEKKAEEERLLRERKEEQEREQQKKKMVVEEKIQEWLQMKKEQEKQEKLLKESKEQEEMQRQRQKQREIEQKAEEKYREWLRRKNLEKMERERRAKEEAACREAQERERRQRADENFKEWLRAQDKSRPSPNAPGCPRGGYDNVTYPSPSFYNPIPWKPIHVPPPEKPPGMKTSRRKQPSQPKYQNSPRIPFRLRDTVSSAARLQRR